MTVRKIATFAQKEMGEKKNHHLTVFVTSKSTYVSHVVCETFICTNIKGGHFFGNKLQEISFKCKKYSLLCCMLMPMCCSKKPCVWP